MKKVFPVLLILSLIFSSVNAQKVYYIYLQTERQQPFYARMSEKVYNSTPSGYLILSNLIDSTYTINIGIQGSSVPDQPFSITVNKKDQGYLVKDFGEKGWGLFNLQTLAVVMPSAGFSNAVSNVKTERREDNDFTNLLAKASDDSTIKEKPVIEKTETAKTEKQGITEEKKEEPSAQQKETNDQNTVNSKKEPEKKEEMKTGSMIDKTPDLNTGKTIAPAVVVAPVVINKSEQEKAKVDSETIKPEQEFPDETYNRSVVTLYSESSNTEGIGLIFFDKMGDKKTDTIKILIPAPKKTTVIVPVTKPEEKKFLDISSVDTLQKGLTTAKPVVNNKCTSVATDDDFFKLRKKMAGETSDDDMITEAKKAFKTKCFTTSQIKNLGSLFLSDEGRYQFFDAAYQYINDTENFPSLESELKDEYFINRFKAMLRQ